MVWQINSLNNNHVGPENCLENFLSFFNWFSLSISIAIFFFFKFSFSSNLWSLSHSSFGAGNLQRKETISGGTLLKYCLLANLQLLPPSLPFLQVTVLERFPPSDQGPSCFYILDPSSPTSFLSFHHCLSFLVHIYKHHHHKTSSCQHLDG